MATTSLVPVDFHGTTLHAVTIDGQPFVSIRSVCDALTVDADSQLKRIKRHAVLSTCTVVTTVQVPGEHQARELVCLPLDMLNGWLFGISAARVRDPARRERLVEYQRECFAVLARHFGRVTTAAMSAAAAAPVTAAPPAVAFEAITRNDLNNIARVVWFISRSIDQRHAMTQAVWFALRQATGVPAPMQFSAHHLPIVATELQRCWALSSVLNEAQRKAEDLVIKRIVRNREPESQILAQAQASLMQAAQTDEAQARAWLSAWQHQELLDVIHRNPCGSDHGGYAEPQLPKAKAGAQRVHSFTTGELTNTPPGSGSSLKVSGEGNPGPVSCVESGGARR